MFSTSCVVTSWVVFYWINIWSESEPSCVARCQCELWYHQVHAWPTLSHGWQARVIEFIEYIHNLGIPDILDYIFPLAVPSRFILVWARSLHSYCVYSRRLYVLILTIRSQGKVFRQSGVQTVYNLFFLTPLIFVRVFETATTVSNTYRCVVVPLSPEQDVWNTILETFGNRLRKTLSGLPFIILNFTLFFIWVIYL